jgi:glutaredoxin-related protein
MSRAILSEDRIDPAIRDKITTHNRDIVEEVEAAIAAHDVVVVGMKQNPFPRRARKALKAHGVPFHYLEYGSYLSTWRRRNALKMWTGWPTFPMVFVKGVLVGGAEDLQKLIDAGELDRRLGRAAKAAT